MQDEINLIMKDILHLLKFELAVDETELYKQFVTSEDMNQVANVKAAVIKLAESNKINLMTRDDGTFVISEFTEVLWH